jgi:DNA-binding SARP family transcriptional activator
MPRLTIALLGPQEVTQDGRPVTDFAYDKVRALLAYLVMDADRPHHRDSLAELLWPDQAEGVARKNLRGALATLRQALGDATAQPPFLLTTQSTIGFNRASDHILDVATFTSQLSACATHRHPVGNLCPDCVTQLEQAVARYRGDFLAQLVVRDSVAFDEWTLRWRERLHRHALDTLGQLSAYYERRGAYESASEHAWRQLELESWCEEAHCCLMRVFARTGQRSAALAQYERCRRVLAEELGVDPSVETIALYERIRAGALEGPARGHQDPGAQTALNSASPALNDVIQKATAKNPSDRYVDIPSLVADLHQAVAAGNLQSKLAPPAASRPPGETPAGTAAALPPTPTNPADTDRSRRRMIEKVQTFWIAGVLERSLHGAAMLDLDMIVQPDAVVDPWDLVVQQPAHADRTFPPGTPIVELYDELGGELLILGAPGSGKTTMLLELARDLLARAVRDGRQPIPVVFNLSPWAEQRLPIAAWLVDELSARYDVPRSIGKLWVDSDQVLPLLDGLDEVAPEHRTACVEAINQFRRAHGLGHIVVCARSTDYDTLTIRLRLQGAIVIQPLTVEQIDTYLAGMGANLAGVRAAVRADATLRALAQTPLMLSIIVLAYRGMPSESLPALDSHELWRTHLFAAYVDRMFQRRSANPPYPRRQTIQWLIWLARALHRRDQTIFFIERLQPDCLPTPADRDRYNIGMELVVGLSFGFVIALVYGLVAALTQSGLGGLVAGLLSALTVKAIQAASSQQRLRPIREALRHGVAAGLVVGLVVGLMVGLLRGPYSGLVVGLLYGLGFGLTLGLVANPNTIEIAETVRWSWTRARSALTGALAGKLMIGLIFGLVLGLLNGLYNGPLSGLVVGLATGLAIMLTTTLTTVGTGLTAGEIETKTRPNQGIWRSAHNALRVGSAVGLGVGLATGVIFGLVQSLVAGGDRLTTALAFGLSYGLPFAFAAGLLYGGLTCVQHVVLRFFLYRAGAAPWKYARFLDYAAERIFLRKVGGGYIFVHRLLLEYFASLDGAQISVDTPAQLVVPPRA